MLDDKYRMGQTVAYHDDVSELRVEVLQNMSRGDRTTYKLKVLKVVELRDGVPALFREKGTEFYCDKPREGSGRRGLWNLVDD
ncbi:MAG: hypothetical protein AABX91_01160 [Nanoarchaeota archaeon]